jgi:excisionase family DNA binding protein|tara:strand:- start:231 stop:410 length:180 start_codon:yes stop_codon:yes gene_type:complete
MNNKSTYLTISEAADLIKVHHQTIRKLISNGDVSAYRLGKQYRIDRVELESFIRRKKVV